MKSFYSTLVVSFFLCACASDSSQIAIGSVENGLFDSRVIRYCKIDKNPKYDVCIPYIVR